MLLRIVRTSITVGAVSTALALGALTWGTAQASTVAQNAPMTHTMSITDTMPGGMAMHESASAVMPVQPAAGSNDMGAMMANMARMQQMMARMQRMMAESVPISGTMPMTGMMGGDMGEMMGMMAEMQGMMGEMMDMMAGEMMAGGMHAGGHAQGQPMMGNQMQGQQSPGGMGMMGQMPMMGAVIIVAPLPMGGMMQQPSMGMMGQMPMMQGAMMSHSGSPDGVTASPSSAGGGAEQSGKLGAIDVKVTPPDLANIQGDTIDFTVDLNATGADLGLDLASLATLAIGGHAMPATVWTVELDHGHHVNGVLSFPAHMSGPVESVTLNLTDPAGGPALSLIWPPVE